MSRARPVPADAPFLRCPRCGATTFYVETARGDWRFFRVRSDGTIVPSPSGGAVGGPEPETFCCTGCSWAGKKEELVAGGAGLRDS